MAAEPLPTSATDAADQSDYVADAGADSTFSNERAEQAADAGFSRPEYAEYARKLAVYEARADTEPLADRRARESGELFTDGDFARAADYQGVSETKQTTRGE